MREMAYYEAKLEALSELMATDESVHLIGGSFLGLSPHRGLFSAIEKNYPDRVIAPPISELGYCGLAIGAAMAGLRPVVDLGTGSFIYEAWPQVVNEAAKAIYMSGGQTLGLRSSSRHRREMSKDFSRPPPVAPIQPSLSTTLNSSKRGGPCLKETERFPLAGRRSSGQARTSP